MRMLGKLAVAAGATAAVLLAAPTANASDTDWAQMAQQVGAFGEDRAKAPKLPLGLGGNLPIAGPLLSGLLGGAASGTGLGG